MTRRRYDESPEEHAQRQVRLVAASAALAGAIAGWREPQDRCATGACEGGALYVPLGSELGAIDKACRPE